MNTPPKRSLRGDLREIGEAAGDGREPTSKAWFSTKLFATGLAMLGIGISQAGFGWAGQGFLYRVLYPIPLIFFGGVILWRSSATKSAERDEGDSA